MSLKTWLLTGTSIGLFAFAPINAHAQDAQLVAAYQAYVAAQQSGDAAALETTQAAFTELCIVGGFASLDDCIASIEASGGAAPAAEEAPAPEAVEEPAPEVIEEPAPVEEPAPEPVPEVAPEPAPEPVPEAVEAPIEEQVIEEPAMEEQVMEEPMTEEMPAEVAPEPAMEEAPAEPMAEEPTAEEPMAEEPMVEEQVAPEPAMEEAAPQDAPAEVTADISADLQVQLDLYNGAVADMMSGGDAATAQQQAGAARAEMERLCLEAGYPDLNTCLADYGVTLPAVPALDAMPADQAPAETAPVEGEAGVGVTEEVTIDGEVIEEPVEIVEDLPEGITQEDLAPVLDSAKDADEPAAEGQVQVEGEVAPQPVVDDQPAPTNDQEAQSRFSAEPVQVMPANEEQGERVEVQNVAPVAVPQNVTIIEQTVVNNNITNNTQNNTVNNTTNNTQNNIVNNVTQTQVVVQVGNQLVISNQGQDTDRFLDYGDTEDEIFYENLSNGRVRETITRADGTQIVTVRNRNGDILRRSRIEPDGREYVLAYFDDQYYADLEVWRDPGDSLPPLRLNIPVSEYVLDAGDADEQQIEVFFSQPPVERADRLYSIDEVKRSARVRDTVRRLEVGNLTFDTGSATISRDQVTTLSAVANAMLGLLETNPAETFLIEGHTDAVGSDVSNLQLSDSRAGTIARILTDFYDVPPENLATQGYGERYLKIRTEAGERENRRVTIRRITPLVTPYVASAQ